MGKKRVKRKNLRVEGSTARRPGRARIPEEQLVQLRARKEDNRRLRAEMEQLIQRMADIRDREPRPMQPDTRPQELRRLANQVNYRAKKIAANEDALRNFGRTTGLEIGIGDAKRQIKEGRRRLSRVEEESKRTIAEQRTRREEAERLASARKTWEQYYSKLYLDRDRKLRAAEAQVGDLRARMSAGGKKASRAVAEARVRAKELEQIADESWAAAEDLRGQMHRGGKKAARVVAQARDRARQFEQQAEAARAQADDLRNRMRTGGRQAGRVIAREREGRRAAEAEAVDLRNRLAAATDPEELHRIVGEAIDARLERMQGANREARAAAVDDLIRNINEAAGRELVRVGEDGGITVDAEVAQAQATGRGESDIEDEIRRRRAMIQDIENDPNLTRWQKRRAKARVLNAEREAGAMARGAEGLGKMGWIFTGLAGNIVLIIVLALVAWIVLQIFPMV